MVLSGLPAGTLSFLICTREPGTKVMAKKHLPYHLCTPHGFILVNQTQQVHARFPVGGIKVCDQLFTG